MSALVIGADLGLGNTSLNTLGLRQGDAVQGQAGDAVTINLGSGNLVLQQQDELLLGRGLNLSTLRTYNSQGLLDGDNNDNWRIGFYRQLGTLNGTLNSAGSSIVRTAADGASERYVWDAARNAYISTAGSGAYDSLAWQGSAGWLWMDGSTGVSETYRSDAAGSPLLLRSQQDANGQVVRYEYAANGLLQKVISASGETTELVYDSTPGRQANLLAVRTSLLDAATGSLKLQTRVRYAYDALNRLAEVSVDLTPQDNSVADGKVFVTRYSYEGSSRRISTLTQSDGSRLLFGYDASARVSSMVDALGATTLYSYEAGSTVVTDALGNVTRYSYDADRQLTRIESPSGTQTFSYNANGDLASMVDAEQRVTTFEYDAVGNQILRRDAAGEVRMTYSARNQLQSELRVAAAESGGGLLTRYIYGGSVPGTHALQLRYAVSAEGRVTEYRYNAYGQLDASIAYSALLWPAGTAADEIALNVWLAAVSDKSKASRTDWRYDFRGQLADSTVYAQLDSAGKGIASSAATTRYIYDAAGRLLQTLAPGAAPSAATTQIYDGLGRILARTNALGQTTSFVYADGGETGSGLRVTQTAADGSISTSAYDRVGRLVSCTSSNSAGVGSTRYAYDANGRLRVVTDPTGVRNWLFYDPAGRQSAQVDGNGSLTEFRYDASGLLVQSIRYAQAANLGGLSVADVGNVTGPGLDQIRPTADAARDQITWNVFDAAGRLSKSVAANGAVTETLYDAAGRVQRVVAYAKAIDTSTLGSRPGASQIAPVADATRDRVTRYFYDRDGLLRGSLDAEGYLSEILYDGAGRAWQSVAYATVARDASAGSLDAARPQASVADIRSFTLHDARGQLAGEVDGEGYLTEHAYDGNGNRIRSTRYATALPSGVLAGLTSNTPVSGLRPAAMAADQLISASYDALNRIVDAVNAEATHTLYAYDAMGNVAARSAAQGSSEERSQRMRYDAQGLLLAELDGEGSAALAALGTNATTAQIEAVWDQYGTRYRYDVSGRRIGMMDANGHLTRYWYDADGQLRYSINAVGDVQGWRYDSLGRLVSQTCYASAANVHALPSEGGLVDAAFEAAIATSSQDGIKTFSYQRDGKLAAAYDELGNVTQYRYNSFGERTAIVSQIGENQFSTAIVDYDRRGLQRSATADAGGLNISTAQSYDAFGRLAVSTNALGGQIRYSYDRLGRQVQSVDTLNIQRSSTYDAFSRVLTQTDGSGKTTVTRYDAAARSVTVTTPEGISLRTMRNRHGETVEVVDGRGNVTRYGYDRNGSLSSVTDALGNSELERYDRAGNQTEHTDARGITTLTRYDAAQRVLSRTVDPQGLALTTRYSYDAKGQVVTITAPDQTVTLTEYDPRGQITTVTRDANGLKLRTTYSWDARGQQLSVTEAAGTSVAATTAYSYDALGRRIAQSVDPDGMNLVTRYVWNATGQLIKAVNPAGHVTRNIYDAGGRLQAQLDPMGALTVWRYDGEGRQTVQLRYAKLAVMSQLPDAPTLAEVMAQLNNPPPAQGTRSLYDGDGRAIFQIDALAQVTRNEYDGNGNLVRQTQYGKPVSLGIEPQRAEVEGALAIVAGSEDRVTRFVYDAANRLVYSISAMDTVTAYQRDAAGNVVQEIAYANSISIAGLPTEASVKSAIAAKAAPTQDRKTTYVMDSDGNAAYVIDAAGYVVQREFDAAGHVLRTIRYAAPITVPADFGIAALQSLLPTSTTTAVVETQTWDAAGRLLDSTDGLGIVTHRDYDAAGRLTDLVVAYGTSAAVRTHYGYDRAGNLLLKTEAAWGADVATTVYRYDALGNVLTEIHALGVELADQDTQWALEQRKTYGVVDASGQPKLAAALSNAEREALYACYSTRREYDAKGRVVREIDPQGGVMRRQYDAFGNLIVLTDPRGNSGSFTYDALDRVVSHTNPLGTSTSTAYTVSGKVASTTQGLATVRYSYDKLDRLLQTTDAEGHVEAQTWDALGNRASFTNKLGGKTVYSYDQLGRKIAETLPITARTGNGTMIAVLNRYAYDARSNLIGSTEAVGLPEQRLTTYEYDAGNRLLKKYIDYNSGRTLVEARVYDLRGNLIESVDGNGRRSLSWYDACNRKISQLDADGALTQWRYNAGEQALAKITYGDALTMPATGAAQPAPINAESRRETLYEYDRKQRLTATIIRNQTIGRYNSSNGQYQLSNGDLVTRQVYDACDNVVQVIDGYGNATRTWYDVMGQKILQLDAEGYGSAWRYDDNGRVIMQTRFAHRPGQDMANADGAALAAGWPASADDRITYYRYDRNGRLLEERQGAVFHGKLDAGGGLTGATSEVITTYVWNGLGQITQKIIANGEVSDFGYDLAGRMVREQGAAFVDFEGTTVRPTTDIDYDGLGNVRQSSRRGKNDASTADDQITYYIYILGGRLLTSVDAMEVPTDYEYDAAGNVIRKIRQRINADGATVLDITTYRHDGHGREIEQTDVGTGISRQTRYNTYGEVIARGTNGGWQEFVEYDAAGRVVKSNSEDGVTRAYVYDAVGNATLKIESSGSDLRGMTLAQMLQTSNGNVDGADGVRLTISAYDKRNQLTDTWEPRMVTSRAGAELHSSTSGVQVQSSNMTGVAVTLASSDVNVALTGMTGKTEVGRGISAQMTPSSVLVTTSARAFALFGNWSPVLCSISFALPNTDAWGTGSVVIEMQASGDYLYPGTNETRYLTSDVRVATWNSTFVYGSSNTFTYSIYKLVGEGKVLLARSVTRIDNSHFISPPVIAIAVPKVALFKSATAAAGSVTLYYRTSGSSGPYQALKVPVYSISNGPISGTYGLDWSILPRGTYDVCMLAVGTDGLVQDYQTGSMSIGDTASINLTAATYGPAVAASLIFETGNLLNLTAQGSSADSMVVRYRPAGSNALWNSTTVLKPSSASGTAIPGWFTWNFGQLSGGYEVIFESHKGSNGDVDLINKIYTTLRLGGATPSILVQPVAYQNRPSTIIFTGNPVAATRVVVRYRIMGSGWDWNIRYLVPSYTGSGTFGWDASDMVPYDQSSFIYEFEYEANDASGLLVNKGGGTLRMGSAAAVLSQYVAPPGALLRFTPQTTAAAMRLFYRARNSSASYAGPITLSRAADGSYSWDAASLKPASGTADFEYFYELLDAQGQTLDRTSGYFSLGTVNSANALQWVINGVSNGGNVIHHQQRINSFGEIVQEVDGLGRTTDFIYDTLGLLAQKLQAATSATLENGYVQTLRPETRYAYDLAGRAIATRDANIMLATQAWLAGGYNKISLVRQADGSVAQYGYDIFGNLRSGRDALGHITTYEYDRNNRLVRLTRPTRDAGSPSAFAGASVDSYEYDQAGNRIAHINALGHRERTYFDSLGRVTRAFSFEGRSTTYTYRYAADLTGVGNLQTGGFIKTTTDANGRMLVDSIDLFGRTLAHQDLGGRSFTYRYNNAGWLVSQTGSNGQSINYEYYANGLLRGIRDLAAHTLSTYEYDAAGNRTFEGYALLAQDNLSVQEYAQQASIEYDAVNRVKRITDPRYSIEYEYDAAGNRRHMLARYHDGVNGSVQMQDYWYAYDAVNRFTTTMGSLSGARATSAGDTSVSVVRGKDGVQLAYDLAGQRRQATYQDANGVLHSERYTYTADGYLEETTIDNVLRARRESDATGRVVRYSENNAAGILSFQRNSSYDGDNLVRRETTLSGGSTDYTRMADGTLSATTSVDSGTTTNTWYSYEWWDSAKQSTITSQPQNASAPGWAAGISHLLYDTNGHLKEARDEAGQTGFRYVTNAQGLIMTREEYMPNALRLQKYYYLDGKRVGDVGNGGPSRMDYVQALAQGGQSKTGARSFAPISSADFDQNYEPINAGYPGATASSYVVRAGDSLRSIAAQVWGDSAMWYLIADANGLTGNEALTAGMSLTIPNKVTNIHNTSETFKVYNPGEAIGDITPNLPVAPPPPQERGGGCGVLGRVIVVVIAVAISVMTGGIGGAMLGSIVSQGVGMALGVQKEFSWSAVALSGLSAAVTGALSGIAPFSGAGESMANTVARAAMANTLTQGIAVATGLQSSFSWQSVAASAVGSGVGWAAGDALGMNKLAYGEAGFGERLMKGSITGFAAAATAAVARGGRIAVQQVAVDAFGRALGDSLTTSISYGNTDASEQQTPASLRMPSLEDQSSSVLSQDEWMRREKSGYQAGDFNRLDVTKSGDTLANLFKTSYGYEPSHAELIQYGNYNNLTSAHDVSLNREIISPSLEDLQNTAFTPEQLQSFSGRDTEYAELRRLAALPPASGLGPTIANARALGIYSGDGNGVAQRAEPYSFVAGGGDPLSPAQKYLLRSDPLYQSAFAGGVYGLARLTGIDDAPAMMLGGMAGMVTEVASARLSGRSGIRQTPYGTTLAEEASGLGRIGENNRTGSPWADLRQAYVRARSQVDFSHIEADVSLKQSGGVKYATGGHFSTSPMVDIIAGTETISPNGVFKAQVNLLGPDGQYYLKTNNSGFSTLTPMDWSLARSKAEMSQAFVNRYQDANGRYYGDSNSVRFMFHPPTTKNPLWRGYPVQ
jgi:YD repeat-containing protein